VIEARPIAVANVRRFFSEELDRALAEFGVRDGPGIKLLPIVTTASDALEVALRERPDVILVDFGGMPFAELADVLVDLGELAPSARVFTVEDEDSRFIGRTLGFQAVDADSTEFLEYFPWHLVNWVQQSSPATSRIDFLRRLRRAAGLVTPHGVAGWSHHLLTVADLPSGWRLWDDEPPWSGLGLTHCERTFIRGERHDLQTPALVTSLTLFADPTSGPRAVGKVGDVSMARGERVSVIDEHSWVSLRTGGWLEGRIVAHRRTGPWYLTVTTLRVDQDWALEMLDLLTARVGARFGVGDEVADHMYGRHAVVAGIGEYELNLGRQYTMRLDYGREELQWDEFLDPWTEILEQHPVGLPCEACSHAWIWHTKIGMCWGPLDESGDAGEPTCACTAFAQDVATP
jgi:hypothetical protein